jgi:hypothetical protein
MAATPPETGVLVVTCPTTGKDLSTGILTDEASLTLTVIVPPPRNFGSNPLARR